MKKRIHLLGILVILFLSFFSTLSNNFQYISKNQNENLNSKKTDEPKDEFVSITNVEVISEKKSVTFIVTVINTKPNIYDVNWGSGSLIQKTETGTYTTYGHTNYPEGGSSINPATYKIETYNDPIFQPGTIYSEDDGWMLLIHYSYYVGPYPFIYEIYYPITFNTLYNEVQPSNTGDPATVTNIDETSATINYSIKLGNDENNAYYDITEVEVYDPSVSSTIPIISESNPNIAVSNDPINNDWIGSGSIDIKDKLTEGTTYSDLYVVMQTTYDDGTKNLISVTQYVEVFTTLYTVNAPVFDSVGTATDITNTSAAINYQINQGNLSNGDPYDIEKVEVRNISISGELLGIDTNLSGTVDLEGLKPNTTYDNLILVAYYNDGTEQTITTTVDSFFTSSERTLPTFSTILIGTTTSTAQLQLTISDFGKDASGNPWTVEDLSSEPIIVDQDGNIIPYNVLSITNNEENETSIIIELINLNSNTNYYNLTAIIYFNDGSGYGEYIFQNFAPDFSTASTVNNFLYFSIFLILGIVIVLVFIYLTISYKKIN